MPSDVGFARDFLADADTCSFSTPIAEAVSALVDYEGLEDTMRSKYVLLVTDGMATCDDPVPAVTALREQVPEIRTFVVGFGGGVDPEELEDMADAGGTLRPGPDPYDQPDDAASLDEAFAAIAGNVLSCDYVLSDAPPLPNLLFIYFDGTEVPRDITHEAGWDFNTTSLHLTFYGAPCDALRTGVVDELLIVYGCALVPED